jgi:hypothetical protein
MHPELKHNPVFGAFERGAGQSSYPFSFMDVVRDNWEYMALTLGNYGSAVLLLRQFEYLNADALLGTQSG